MNRFLKPSLLIIAIYCGLSCLLAGIALEISPIQTEGEFNESIKVLKDAFTDRYKDIPLVDLNIGQPNSKHQSLDMFLESCADDERASWLRKEDTAYFCYAKTEDDKIVGYISYKFYPLSNSVYIPQLGVDPNNQRRRVGEKLVDVILKQFPDLTRLYVFTRKINKVAIDFYTQGLGFTESADRHEGPNSELYIGFEKLL